MKTTMKVMAALLIMLTASVSVKAQVFEKVNDSLYMLRDLTWPGRDSVVRYAVPMDMAMVVARNSATMRVAGTCYTSAVCLSVASGLFAYGAGKTWGHDGHKGLLACSIITGAASLVFTITGSVKLMGNRVYVGSDGVVVKLSKTEKIKKR